jgi:hypothetical protein
MSADRLGPEVPAGDGGRPSRTRRGDQTSDRPPIRACPPGWGSRPRPWYPLRMPTKDPGTWDFGPYCGVGSSGRIGYVPNPTC